VILAALALVAQGALPHRLDVLLRDADAALHAELEHLALEELAAQLVAVVLLGEPGALRVVHQLHTERFCIVAMFLSAASTSSEVIETWPCRRPALQLVVDHLLQQLLEDLRLGGGLLRPGGIFRAISMRNGLARARSSERRIGRSPITATTRSTTTARAARGAPATPAARRARDRARRRVLDMAAASYHMDRGVSMSSRVPRLGARRGPSIWPVIAVASVRRRAGAKPRWSLVGRRCGAPRDRAVRGRTRRASKRTGNQPPARSVL